MRIVRTGFIFITLICTSNVLADEAAERFVAESMEQFDHLHNLMMESFEQSKGNFDNPLPQQVENQYLQIRDFVRNGIRRYEGQIPDEVMNEIGFCGDLLAQLIREFVERKGNVELAHIESTANAYHQIIDLISGAIGVEFHPEVEPEFFDVTAQLHFSVSDATVFVSTVTPHFRIETDLRDSIFEQDEEDSVGTNSRWYLECEGELEPRGERWVLHVFGRVEFRDEVRETDELDNMTSDSQISFSFDTSALIRPDSSAIDLAGPEDSPLEVMLRLKD